MAISYLNEHDDANVTAHWVTEAGRKAVKIPGDIGNAEHCRRVVEQTVRECGQLDILVNNAAYQMTHDKLEDWSEERDRAHVSGKHHFDVPSRKAAAPHMKPGGVIINTSSSRRMTQTPNFLPTPPRRVRSPTSQRPWPSYWANKGFRVNAVAPGPVWTPLIPSTMPGKKLQKFGADTLFGRPAQPAELAPLYVFLASADASYVTGEIYGATGGQTPL